MVFVAILYARNNNGVSSQPGPAPLVSPKSQSFYVTLFPPGYPIDAVCHEVEIYR